MKKLFFIYFLVVICFPCTASSSEHSKGITIVQANQNLSNESFIKGKYRALIIGINKYKNLGDSEQLDSPVKDCKAISDILYTKYGFNDIISLYDFNASRKAVIASFEKLVEIAQEEDSILIYYAGHGTYDKKTDRGWWIPSDGITNDLSTHISNSTIREYLNAIKSKHILVVADSCFSSSLIGKTRSLPPLGYRMYKELYEDKSRWALVSGGLYPVPDSSVNGHSLFAYTLIRILERNQNPYIIPQQIYNNAYQLIANNQEQIPRIAPIKDVGDMGGQFVFKTYQKSMLIADNSEKKQVQLENPCTAENFGQVQLLNKQYLNRLYYQDSDFTNPMNHLINQGISSLECITKNYETLNPEARFTAFVVINKIVKKMASPDISNLYYEGIIDSNPWVRTEAVWGLGFTSYTFAIPKIILLLDDPDSNVRNEAILTLNKLNGQNKNIISNQSGNALNTTNEIKKWKDWFKLNKSKF